VSLLDLALGDRAGTYLLISCLLVATLAIIAAILELPLRALREAGYLQNPRRRSLVPLGLLQILAATAAVFTFIGAALQAYLASAPFPVQSNFLALCLITNVSFFDDVAILGLTPPLTRHWGLGVGAFGLGLATLFLMLAAVLQLPFSTTGELQSEPARRMFALEAGFILLAIGACLAAILSLLTRIIRTTAQLASEYKNSADWLTSDWNTTRKLRLRHLRSHGQARIERQPSGHDPTPLHPTASEPNEAELP
jgi:hypothetical protein